MPAVHWIYRAASPHCSSGTLGQQDKLSTSRQPLTLFQRTECPRRPILAFHSYLACLDEPLPLTLPCYLDQLRTLISPPGCVLLCSTPKCQKKITKSEGTPPPKKKQHSFHVTINLQNKHVRCLTKMAPCFQELPRDTAYRLPEWQLLKPNEPDAKLVSPFPGAFIQLW